MGQPDSAALVHVFLHHWEAANVYNLVMRDEVSMTRMMVLPMFSLDSYININYIELLIANVNIL